MPWGDCTGPWWTGTREERTGNYNSCCRRTHGRGDSCGRRFGRSFGAQFLQPSKEDEKSYLEALASDLESKLKNVRDRIEGLQSKIDL
jgi:hypothetical protein